MEEQRPPGPSQHQPPGAEPPPRNDDREGDPTDHEVHNASEITAPSIGPHTKISHTPPEERLAAHEQSNVDAMGEDKRRQVIGHSYGPSRRQQLTFFGIVGAVILVFWIGSKILVSEFDQAPASNPDAAPWSGSNAPQTPPQRPF